ncbi:MAG TPA: hypothetical protein PLY91_04875 [Methanoregulaceae archaeon]|nr:hypothetical protein [Methanoregulaceae archaeon]
MKSLEIFRTFDKLEKKQSWDLSESDEQISAAFAAFERDHLTISDRYRQWEVHEGKCPFIPDDPDDSPDNGESFWLEPLPLPQNKNGIEQVRVIVKPRLDLDQLREIIEQDRILKGDKNYTTRGDVLRNFLLVWITNFPLVRIQDSELEKIFTQHLEICKSERRAEFIIDRLDEHKLLLRKEVYVRKSRGDGYRTKPFVYWVPNRSLLETHVPGRSLLETHEPTTNEELKNDFLKIVQITAALQLDRDAAIKILKDHDLLSEYKQLRSNAQI